jgi:hypothetical protein
MVRRLVHQVLKLSRSGWAMHVGSQAAMALLAAIDHRGRYQGGSLGFIGSRRACCWDEECVLALVLRYAKEQMAR